MHRCHPDSRPCGELRGRQDFFRRQQPHHFQALLLGGARAFRLAWDSPFFRIGEAAHKFSDRPLREAGAVVLGGRAEADQQALVHPFSQQAGADPKKAGHFGERPDSPRVRPQPAFNPRARLDDFPCYRGALQQRVASLLLVVLRRSFHGSGAGLRSMLRSRKLPFGPVIRSPMASRASQRREYAGENLARHFAASSARRSFTQVGEGGLERIGVASSERSRGVVPHLDSAIPRGRARRGKIVPSGKGQLKRPRRT